MGQSCIISAIMTTIRAQYFYSCPVLFFFSYYSKKKATAREGMRPGHLARVCIYPMSILVICNQTGVGGGSGEAVGVHCWRAFLRNDEVAEIVNAVFFLFFPPCSNGRSGGSRRAERPI